MAEIFQIIPSHERRILEAHVRKVPLSSLPLLTDPLNEYEQEELKNLLRLRMQGLPLQYLTGSQDFYGRTFYVNTHVLVPRPETEGLVELTLNEIRSQKIENPRILDFGTGSGCIGISLSLEVSGAKVFGCDASQEALDVARENCKALRALHFDFRLVPEQPSLDYFNSEKEFDVIVSNPPYLIQTDDISDEVRQNEPELALFAPDEEGMFFFNFLSILGQKKLTNTGFMAVEISHDRAEQTIKVFRDKGYYVECKKDLTERPRYLLIRKN